MCVRIYVWCGSYYVFLQSRSTPSGEKAEPRGCDGERNSPLSLMETGEVEHSTSTP